ncbi:MAG: hypothetical protein OXE99_13565, partial [Cellvibrionales bacterium]|nr:hypothetical protein [Cellvibrionales bacterium]
SARASILDGLSILKFKSTSSNQATIKAISFILKHRTHKKKTLPIYDKNGQQLVSVGRVSKKWKKRIYADI